MSYSFSTFTITTSTYTVADTFSYDLYYVDTSVSNTAITITLPAITGNNGSFVRFKSITSSLAGNTTNNVVTLNTNSASDSIDFTGVTSTTLARNGYLYLTAQDNGGTNLWTSPTTSEYISGVYGDGSDGTVTAVTGSLASDMYYDNLIVPNGVSLKTAGFRISVRNLLTLQGTGNINNDGLAGGNGSAVAGTGAAGLAAQYYASTGGGGNGGLNGNGVNAPVTGTTQSVGGSGGAGGATTGPAHTGGTGGTTAAVTAANGGTKVLKQAMNAIGGFLPTGIRFNVANGGGGGASSNGTSGGGGGGAGGGMLLLCARNILVTGTGSRISANGGNGGNGGGGGSSSGGGGGGGGAVVIVTQTPNLTTNYVSSLTVSANGGTGGTGVGGGGASGVAGTAGTTPVVLSM